MTTNDYQPLANKLDFGDIEKYEAKDFKNNFTECMYKNEKKKDVKIRVMS